MHAVVWAQWPAEKILQKEEFVSFLGRIVEGENIMPLHINTGKQLEHHQHF